jgi:hypothetical protein
MVNLQNKMGVSNKAETNTQDTFIDDESTGIVWRQLVN